MLVGQSLSTINIFKMKLYKEKIILGSEFEILAKIQSIRIKIKFLN